MRQHRHFFVRRDGQEPVGPVVGLDVAELEAMFFSRSTIAERCTQGQVLKLTSRYFAMISSRGALNGAGIARPRGCGNPPHLNHCRNSIP